MTGSKYIVRAFALAVLLVLGLACIAAAAQRATKQLPFGLSCHLPTSNSCFKQLTERLQSGTPQDVVGESEALAKGNPADARLQAFHGSVLAKLGREDEADIYLLNAARLGWREPVSQAYSYIDALTAGDYARAALNLDALLRVQPERASQDELLAPMLAIPDLRNEFAARLALRPLHLQRFIGSTRNPQRQYWAERIEVLALARAHGLEIADEEIKDVGWDLFRADPASAAQQWAAIRGEGDWASGSPAWSAAISDDALSAAVTPFAWHARRSSRNLPRLLVQADGTTRLGGYGTTTASVELASIALRPRSQTVPIEWRSGGKAGKITLAAKCARSGDASIVRTSDERSGLHTGLLALSPDCNLPIVSVLRTSGSAADDWIANIAVSGFPILK